MNNQEKLYLLNDDLRQLFHLYFGSGNTEMYDDEYSRFIDEIIKIFYENKIYDEDEYSILYNPMIKGETFDIFTDKDINAAFQEVNYRGYVTYHDTGERRYNIRRIIIKFKLLFDNKTTEISYDTTLSQRFEHLV